MELKIFNRKKRKGSPSGRSEESRILVLFFLKPKKCIHLHRHLDCTIQLQIIFSIQKKNSSFFCCHIYNGVSLFVPVCVCLVVVVVVITNNKSLAFLISFSLTLSQSFPFSLTNLLNLFSHTHTHTTACLL